MLPTLLFILWAYGIYALISVLSGRKGASPQRRRSWRRYGWLGLLAGVGMGLGLVVVMAQSFEEQPQNLRLAGFLGTVWAEGVSDKVTPRVEEPPIKGTASGIQPGYALLNPATSPAELAKEKTGLRPRPVIKPKMRKAPVLPAKGSKGVAQTPKKDQLTADKDKTKTTKKKKPAASTPEKKAATG